MKKVVAIILTLAMVLTMALSLAEETVSTYVLTTAFDAEGNAITIGDENMPVLVMAIDGASNNCAFGTQDGQMPCTYEIVAGEDGVYVLTLTNPNGETTVMFYDAESDTWVAADEDTGVVMYFENLANLAE